MVERCVRDAEVVGSNPVASIKKDTFWCPFLIDLIILAPRSLADRTPRSGAEGAACQWHAFSTDRSEAQTVGSNPFLNSYDSIRTPDLYRMRTPRSGAEGKR